jgi:hypothetical protein
MSHDLNIRVRPKRGALAWTLPASPLGVGKNRNARYMAASAISRINQKPYVLGSVAMLWGWVKSALDRKPRYHDAAFREFLRRYQKRVLLVGKKRAIEEIHPLAK